MNKQQLQVFTELLEAELMIYTTTKKQVFSGCRHYK